MINKGAVRYLIVWGPAYGGIVWPVHAFSIFVQRCIYCYEQRSISDLPLLHLALSPVLDTVVGPVDASDTTIIP